MDPALLRSIVRIVTFATLAIGLALASGGGFKVAQYWSFRAAAAEAEGEVVKNEESWVSSADFGRSHTSYLAIIKFTDTRGEPVTLHDSVGFNPPLYRVGDRLKIFYDPGNTTDAMIDRGALSNLIANVAFGFGVLLVLSSLRKLWQLAAGEELQTRNT